MLLASVSKATIGPLCKGIRFMAHLLLQIRSKRVNSLLFDRAGIVPASGLLKSQELVR